MSTSLHHQRVEAAFCGHRADRIAICEQAFASSVASELLGRTMHTGSTELHFHEALARLAGASAYEDFLKRVYDDTLALHRELDWDICFCPWRNEAAPSRQLDEFTILYGNQDGDDWEVWRLSPHSRTYGRIDAGRPPMECDELCKHLREQVRMGWEKATPMWIDRLVVRAAREVGAEFVVAAATGMAVPLEPGWLEATVIEPELLGEYFDMHVQRMLAELDTWHRHGVRLISFGGDFAFNSGPVYSPKFFETIMAPRWKRLYDRCRELGMWCIQRSDGNLWLVAQSLFGWAKPHAYYECDYDAGMRFGELREAFPDLVLIGNVSSDLLVRGTAEEVRQRALECIDAAAPRVVLSSANAVLPSTPVQNILAMYDAARTNASPAAAR